MCRLTLLLLTLVLLQAFVIGEAQSFAAPAQSKVASKLPEQASIPPPAEATDVSIPLPQIADRAQELDRQLRDLNAELTPKAELTKLERAAESDAAELRQRAAQVDEILAATPTVLELEDELRYWRSRSRDYELQRKHIKTRAAQLEKQIQILDAENQIWQATWNKIKDSTGIDSVVERVRGEREYLTSTHMAVQRSLNLVLTLQNHIAQTDQEISEVLLQIRSAEQQERGRLLEWDSPPIWVARKQQVAEVSVGAIVYRSCRRTLTNAREFVRGHKLGLFALLAGYVVALFGAFKLRRLLTHGRVSPIAEKIFCLPYSVALLLAIFAARQYMLMATNGIAFVFYLLYLVPVLRLVPRIISPLFTPLLYVLSVFYTIASFYVVVQLPPLLRREIFAGIALAAIVTIGWQAVRLRKGVTTEAGITLTLARLGIRSALVLLLCSLIANIIGFVTLAQVLGLTAIFGAFAGVALYCAVRVVVEATSVLAHGERVRAVLEWRSDAVVRWVSRTLGAAACLLWCRVVLRLLDVYDRVITAVSSALKYSIGFDKVHFTVGGVLKVILIMIVGYMVANTVKFVLKKVILPKLPLPRGIPYAVSTIAYYVLLLLVVVAALSDAGIELNKFTVLTGALGVGLGFGLQNIVNNFVSGLILLFERPIHVGDVIDVNGLGGSVRHIGARSVTMVAAQGAEVIVPNSNLLSNQVVNWTLSSPWRRVDVKVRVAYGTDPKVVLNLLVNVAKSYPGILRERAPEAFFLGFGDSALDFELRFWSARQETSFQLQSDVAVSIFEALTDAGIEIPFPQRDLHLRSIDKNVTDLLADQIQGMNSSVIASTHR